MKWHVARNEDWEDVRWQMCQTPKKAANWDKAEVENNDDTEVDEDSEASNQKISWDWSLNKPSQGPVQLNLGQPWTRQTIAEVSLVDGINIGDYG